MINLVSLMDKFQTDDDCREVLESIRWPNGVHCSRCGCVEIFKIPKYDRYECKGCGYQFSVMSGTIMHDSHLPLRKWFIAIYLMCKSKKGISANQMKRTLGISYKTAWYLCHRIRQAMGNEPFEGPTLIGIVEVDETLAELARMPSCALDDWPLPFASVSKLVGAGGAAAELANQTAGVWRGVIEAVPDGGRALIVTHGGIIELGAVAAVPAGEHRSWGGPIGYCEGVRLTFDGDFLACQVLRVPERFRLIAS